MKPVILTFARYYLPGYRAGGPIRSIANIAERLSNDFDFRIVTLDRDLGDALSYPSVQVDSWNLVRGSRVYYASRSHLSVRHIARLIVATPHDVLYLNSFFDPVFTFRPLLAQRLGFAPSRPVIVAPRGEFSEGALKLKPWTKIPYLAVARGLCLLRRTTWQASTDREAGDIVRIMRTAATASAGSRVLVAADLIDNSYDEDKLPIRSTRTRGQPLRVCFVSRISPMKNLDYALRVLGQVGAGVHFSIYGTKETLHYWRVCEQLIDALPPHVTWKYHGPVDHESVVQTIAQHDLFLLPTRGENFGHVIHEALRARVPVLVSDQTPWRDLEEWGAGWALPLDKPKAFVQVIEEVAKWNIGDWDTASKAARSLALHAAEDQRTLEANRKLFYSAMKVLG